MTFYWHDYETFGRSPRSDRPAQFAGMRTDMELEVVGGPTVLYCRPGADMLPDPDACLVHGILPHDAIEKGVPEAEFAARIHAELAAPQTCGVGYNAMRFDHEVTRYLFYRNLFDPYAWHWQNGNSRWDVIDLARAACALRPDGICWPMRDDGAHSFVLEDLARANGIEHEDAHDALADVRSLLGLARLLRSVQRPLFDYYLRLRSKQAVSELIDYTAMRPLVFVSGRIRASLGGATLVAPLAQHPTDGNGVIVYDLRLDPSRFLGMSSEDLQHDLFAREDELPEGVIRPPLRHIHLNASPFLADARSAADPEVQERLSLDFDACMAHLDVLRSRHDFRENAAKAFVREWKRRSKKRSTPAVSSMTEIGGCWTQRERRTRPSSAVSERPGSTVGSRTSCSVTGRATTPRRWTTASSRRGAHSVAGSCWKQATALAAGSMRYATA